MQNVKENEVTKAVEAAFVEFDTAIRARVKEMLENAGAKSTPENIKVFTSRWENIIEQSEKMLFMTDGNTKKIRSFFFIMCTKFIEVEEGEISDTELTIMWSIFDILNEL